MYTTNCGTTILCSGRGSYRKSCFRRSGLSKSSSGLPAKASVPAEAGSTSRTSQQKRPRGYAAPHGLVFSGFAPGMSRHAARPGCLGSGYLV